LSELPLIPPEDLAQIKSIFGIDTFFAIETVAYEDGVIFKGNLRGEVEYVYESLAKKLKDLFADKYHLFFVESSEDKPTIIILPSSGVPKSTTFAQKNLALVLFLATVVTSMEAVGTLFGFDWFNQLSRYQEILPWVFLLLTIVGIHELSHHLIAKYYQIRLSIPFFLPTWQIGSLGTITRFESILPNRKILFDISLAGPATGGMFSLSLLIVGFFISNQGSILHVPSQIFQSSILVGGLAHLLLRDSLQQSFVNISPLVVIGWLGLVITALNLFPAGQLDGGRIALAIYGRKTARRITITTIIILGLISLVNLENSLALYWELIIIFLQREAEKPSLNEITDIDNFRALLGLLSFFFLLLILIPFSPFLVARLGF